MKTVTNLFAKSFAVLAFVMVCLAGFTSCDDEVITIEKEIIIEEDSVPLVAQADFQASEIFNC